MSHVQMPLFRLPSDCLSFSDVTGIPYSEVVLVHRVLHNLSAVSILEIDAAVSAIRSWGVLSVPLFSDMVTDGLSTHCRTVMLNRIKLLVHEWRS